MAFDAVDQDLSGVDFDIVFEFAGERVLAAHRHVHGIALAPSKPNTLLSGSGMTAPTITALPSGDVIGFLDSVTRSAQEITISGWACVKGLEDSISVHVYAAGPAGVGRFITAGTAKINRESAVAQACGTTGLAHGYSIVLNQEQSSIVSGQKIYVHGIARDESKPNSLLANSGLVAPTVEVGANVTPSRHEK